MASTGINYDKQLFESIKSNELLLVVNALTKHGYEVRLVGGIVRDIILGKNGADIDLSTDATPEQMKQVFDNAKLRYIETGIQHGTLTVHINQKDFEVTTLRMDVVTDGRHAEVEYVKDWKLDAERRDLTINAMSMCVKDGKLYDYFDGYQHLVDKRVQFVGDARTRIREDYLRILRYFRFLGRISSLENIIQLETNLDANHNPPYLSVLGVIKEEAHGLKNISVERIWSELKRIIVGPNARSILKLMYLADVLKYSYLSHVNPSHIERFNDVDRNVEDAIKQLILTRESSSFNFSIYPPTILASLVDDEKQAEFVGNLLKFSNNEKSLLRFIVRHRTDFNNSSVVAPPLKKYKDLMVSNYKPKEADTLRNHILQLILFESTCDNYLFMFKWTPPIFPVTGNHMKAKNLKGKEISTNLDKLKKLWMESDYSLTLDQLLNQL